MIDTAKNFFETIFLKFIGSFGNIFSSLDQSLTLHHFIIFALLILFSGFFSAAEIAIFHVKEYQIQDENGKLLKKKYRFLYKLVASKEMILSTILIGNNIANVFASIYGSYLFTKVIVHFGMAKEFAVSLSSFILILFILFFGEIIPKNIAIFNSFRLGVFISPLIYFFYILFYPLAKTSVALAGLISRLFGRSEEESISDNQLLAIVNTGEKQGVFEKSEKTAIKNILEFTDTTASEIMTPRTSTFTLSAEEKLQDVIASIVEQDYSRIPIYRDKIDNITAVIHQKDVFKQLLKKDLQPNLKLSDIANEATYVYKKTSIVNILENFQKERKHIAIVVDDFGSFDGIITLEDILEEIVGEISDEADKHKDDSYILPLGENTWFAKNVVDLNSFCRITGADPELHDKQPYDTLQGLIMFHLKRLPKVGDRIEVDNFSFEVKNMVEDQIILIQIKKTTSSNEKE